MEIFLSVETDASASDDTDRDQVVTSTATASSVASSNQFYLSASSEAYARGAVLSFGTQGQITSGRYQR